MDRISDSDSEDAGSIPAGATSPAFAKASAGNYWAINRHQNRSKSIFERFFLFSRPQNSTNNSNRKGTNSGTNASHSIGAQIKMDELVNNQFGSHFRPGKRELRQL